MGLKTYSLKKYGNVKLSENFKVSEFKCNDGSDTILIDTALVTLLQKIRNHFKNAVIINSAYRTPTYNAKIGGATNSYHKKGMAADIQVKNTSPEAVAEYCESIGVKGIGCGANYVHVDTRTKKSYWRYVGTTTRTYSVSTFLENKAAIVKTIQRFLNTTYNAGLSVDGIIGDKTRKATDNAVEKVKNNTIKLNSKGNPVYVLQAALYCLGYNPNGFDGVYGNGTKTAVEKFQKEKGLSSDGVVGENTWNKLKEVL